MAFVFPRLTSKLIVIENDKKREENEKEQSKEKMKISKKKKKKKRDLKYPLKLFCFFINLKMAEVCYIIFINLIKKGRRSRSRF